MKINEVLTDSLDLCRRAPLVFVPMLAAVVFVALVSLLLAGTAIPFVGAMESGFAGGSVTAEDAVAGAGIALGGLMLLSILSSVATLLAHSMTISMAYDAVQGRPVTLKAGWEDIRGRIVPLVIAVVLVGLAVGIGMALLVLPGLIVGFLLMFTFTAIMVDGNNALAAIKTSVSTVTANFGAVLVVFLVAIALGVIFMLVNVIVGLIPILGPLVAIIVSSAFSSYLTVFLLQAYLTLRDISSTPDVEV